VLLVGSALQTVLLVAFHESISQIVNVQLVAMAFLAGLLGSYHVRRAADIQPLTMKAVVA
jgi:hypothetical protein